MLQYPLVTLCHVHQVCNSTRLNTACDEFCSIWIRSFWTTDVLRATWEKDCSGTSLKLSMKSLAVTSYSHLYFCHSNSFSCKLRLRKSQIQAPLPRPDSTRCLSCFTNNRVWYIMWSNTTQNKWPLLTQSSQRLTKLCFFQAAILHFIRLHTYALLTNVNVTTIL